MEKRDIEFKIKETCDEHSPDVLSKIKNSSEFRIPEKPKRSFAEYFSLKRLSYSLATIFIVALVVTLVLTSGPSTPVVASTITLDINPSIQITLDEDDFVINITGLNDDGEAVVSRDVKYRGLTLDRAIEILIEEAHRRGFIVDTTDENVILIKVDSNNEVIRARVEAQLETKIDSEVKKYSQLVRVIKERNPNVTDEQLENLVNIAKENHITVAKLLLIRRIIVLDDRYTVAELKNVSIRGLYLLEYNLLNPDEENDNPGNGGDDPGNGDDNPGNNAN